MAHEANSAKKSWIGARSRGITMKKHPFKGKGEKHASARKGCERRQVTDTEKDALREKIETLSGATIGERRRKKGRGVPIASHGMSTIEKGKFGSASRKGS